VANSQNNFTYTVDGVHPTGEGYAIWTGIVKEALK
jgi:lysophospholipase L1-like esterase